MTRTGEITGWLSLSARDAAKIPAIQAAAFAAAGIISAQTQTTILAAEYADLITIAPDSCERYEQFMERAEDNLTRTRLFNLHVNRFGCTDVPRHADEVVRLARIFFRR